MSEYIFILRKKDITIELLSSDPVFITKQMKLWQGVMAPGLTSIKEKPKPPVEKPLKKQAPPLAKAIEESVVEESAFEPVLEEEEDLLVNLDQTLDDVEAMTKEIHDNLEEEIEEPLEADMSELLEEMVNVEVPETEEVQEEPIKMASKEPPTEKKKVGIDDLIAKPISFGFKKQEPKIPVEPETQAEGVEEDSDIRITESVETEEDVIPDDMDDMSALLAEFEAETATEETNVSEEEAEKIETSQTAEPVDEDLFQQFAEAEETGAKETTADYDLDEDMLKQFAELEAEAENIKMPAESEADDDLLSSFGLEDAGVSSKTPIIPPDDPDDNILSQFEEETQTVAETEEDDFDSLISAMTAEVEQEEQQSEPEIPEAVKQIKKELQQKRDTVPIDAYFNSLTLKTPVDILLATVSYMENFESKVKFTQKDISARTFKAINKPISPNIMLAAVNKGYIEVVPDFTGTSESNEYSLTESGRDYILKELS